MSGVTSFTIDLDRPNGIYYGGEVVRGKVRLVTSKDITTRGVRVRYQGNGYMHFHTGSGDNRNDYYGSKVYEEHRYTMFGNYYNTSILDEAGSDAVFGAAGGDGIMYIPCNENEPLSLIVRVMDYDFGKKDDLLGEIVLDANSLLSSGEPKSFPLIRHGKSEKGEVTLSAKVVPVNALFPASKGSDAPFAGFGRAQGRTYNAILELRTHQATGLRKADFIGKNDVYVQAYRAPHGVNAHHALPAPDLNTVLSAGTLEFPFAFTVRADAPGSAELRVGDAAHIRYSLYANVDIAWWRDPSVRRVITVLPSRPLAAPALMRGLEYKCDAPMNLASCCCFPCFTGIGNVTIDAKILRQAFAPGEKLEFAMRMHNNTSETLSVEVVLLCSVFLQVTGVFGGSANFEIPYVLHSSNVNPQSTYELSSVDTNTHLVAIDNTTAAIGGSSAYTAVPTTNTNTNTTSNTATLTVPTVYPSFNGASGLNKSGRDPTTYAYSVVFRATTPGMCGTTKGVTLPVVICAAPPSASALHTSRLSTPALQPTSDANPFSLAYSRAYVPAPDASASGGGGGGASAPAASVVPIGSSVVTFLKEEDSAAVTSAAPYQPYSLVYPSAPVDTTSTGITTPNTTGNTTGATNITALTQALTTSTDLRATVRAHLHPTTTLSPSDVQVILQSVTFSMDQVTVAHEIAQIVRIACAHVVVACNVCSFFKTEIVSAMAPYVSDSGNKETVLVLLPSYERSKVEALFPQV